MNKAPGVFDVVVVGGGVIGLSCAWRLAQRGQRVLVLERAACGSGATGAALGALWPAGPLIQGALQEMQRASLWSYPAFAQEMQAATGLDIGYRRQGRILLLEDATQADRARQEVPAAAMLWPACAGGPVMEVLSAQQVQALEPAVKAGGLSGQLCRASAQVDVARLLAGLLAVCQKAGVVVREHCAVSALEICAGRIAGVRCGAELLAAHKVLITAGAWTPRLHPALAAYAPIKPVRGQVLRLRCPQPVITRIIKRGKVYLVPWGDEVLVGSTTEKNVGFNTKTTPEGVAFLLAGAQALVPALRDATEVRAWAGLRPDGPRHQPVTGPVPGVAGLYVSAGHYKIGIGLAPEVGRRVAAMLTAE